MGKSTSEQFLAESSIKLAGLTTNEIDKLEPWEWYKALDGTVIDDNSEDCIVEFDDQSHAQWVNNERAWVPVDVDDYIIGCAQARKWGAVDYPTALTLYGRHLRQTRERCEALAARGYLFVPGNHPKLDKSKRWSSYNVVRVAICNSRAHGFSLKTIWAVRPQTDERSA